MLLYLTRLERKQSPIINIRLKFEMLKKNDLEKKDLYQRFSKPEQNKFEKKNL